MRDLAENIVKLAKVAQIQYHIVEHIHIHVSHKSRNISGNSLLHALSMQDGLQRRGHMEVGFLNEVDEIVRTGTSILLSYIDLLKHRAILCVPKLNFHSSPPLYQGVTQAEKLAGLYMTKWQGNVDPVFREFMY